MTQKEKYDYTFRTLDIHDYLHFSCKKGKASIKNGAIVFIDLQDNLSCFISCLQDNGNIDFVLENINGAINGTYFDEEPLSDPYGHIEIKITRKSFKIDGLGYPIEDVKELLLEWREFIISKKTKPYNLQIKKVGFWENLYNIISGIK